MVNNLYKFGKSQKDVSLPLPPYTWRQKMMESRKKSYLSDKPLGWWVSVKSDWKEWWMEEMNDTKKVACSSRVYVPSNVLIIVKNMKELEQFTSEYGTRLPNPPYFLKNYSVPFLWIDWKKVLKDNPDKQGFLLEMKPSTIKDISNMNPSFFWTWSWDVRSGVFWDLQKVSTQLTKSCTKSCTKSYTKSSPNDR